MTILDACLITIGSSFLGGIIIKILVDNNSKLRTIEQTESEAEEANWHNAEKEFDVLAVMMREAMAEGRTAAFIYIAETNPLIRQTQKELTEAGYRVEIKNASPGFVTFWVYWDNKL